MLRKPAGTKARCTAKQELLRVVLPFQPEAGEEQDWWWPGPGRAAEHTTFCHATCLLPAHPTLCKCLKQIFLTFSTASVDLSRRRVCSKGGAGEGNTREGLWRTQLGGLWEDADGFACYRTALPRGSSLGLVGSPIFGKGQCVKKIKWFSGKDYFLHLLFWPFQNESLGVFV